MQSKNSVNLTLIFIFKTSLIQKIEDKALNLIPCFTHTHTQQSTKGIIYNDENWKH